MKPNIEMFGIDLLKDVTAVESWTKTSKSKSSIEPTVTRIENTLKAVFEELRTDFDL